MSIGDGRKTYSDSALKSMTKDELIDIIRCLCVDAATVYMKLNQRMIGIFE